MPSSPLPQTKTSSCTRALETNWWKATSSVISSTEVTLMKVSLSVTCKVGILITPTFKSRLGSLECWTYKSSREGWLVAWALMGAWWTKTAFLLFSQQNTKTNEKRGERKKGEKGEKKKEKKEREKKKVTLYSHIVKRSILLNDLNLLNI